MKFKHNDDYSYWHELDNKFSEKKDDNSGWTDAEKALWILENGPVEYCWIYERVDNTVFRRPVMADPSMPVPPWINKEREEILHMDKSKQRLP